MIEAATAWLQGEDALATTARTIVVYALSLLIVRTGSKRFLSKASAFDTVVAIMLGSIMSRAITMSSAILPTVLSGAVLVAVHWLLAPLASRARWLGPIVMGEPRTLIRDGVVDEGAMRATGVARHDLDQALRAHAKRPDPSRVALAVLERDGSISVIPAERPPAVLDVSVEAGVQTVRIRVE